MTLPRLVATDLDGTLLRSDGTLSDRTIGVLADLDRSGIPVVVVTARPLRAIEELRPMIGGHGLAIVSNGALVHDAMTGRVVATHGMDRAVGLDLVDRITTALPGASFAIEVPAGIRRDPTYVDRIPAPAGSPVGDLVDLWDQPALKLLVRHERRDPADLQAIVAATVGDRATPTWSASDLVEISAAGVTKATTLASVADGLGISRGEVVAFGDAPNDLPMLTWAGTAYAMANAHADVIAAADHVAPGNDEDGVATVLRVLFRL